ncbi:MAG: major facilitator superfamily 1 [Klenkia sp.]|nr:major facilitator superfamily 1 [Klenkia sp.]
MSRTAPVAPATAARPAGWVAPLCWVGAVVGLLVAGQVADRIGARRAGMAWSAAGALFLALLSIRLPLGGSYAMVFRTGCFVFSAQVLVHPFTSSNHPPHVQATALA